MPEQQIILARLSRGGYRVDRLGLALQMPATVLSEHLQALQVNRLVESYQIRGRAWVRTATIQPPPVFEGPFIPRCLLKTQ